MKGSQQPQYITTITAGGVIAKNRFVNAGNSQQSANPGLPLIGVSQQAASAANEYIAVASGGILLIEAGGNIAAGAYIQSGDGGKAYSYTPAQQNQNEPLFVPGIALEAAANGDTIRMLWMPLVFCNTSASG